MRKINAHIEIVGSSLTALCSMGRESRLAILAVLSQHYTHVGITLVNDLAALQALVARKPDLVFLGAKYLPLTPELGIDDPQKIWLGDYLDQHGITYTGSDGRAHELEFRKVQAKQCVQLAGHRTAASYVARQDTSLSPNDITLRYPVFIKPTSLGGGIGVDASSVAHTFSELAAKVESIAVKLRSDALIEDYLPGREFSVAVLKSERDDTYSAMPIELVSQPEADGSSMLSQAVKSSNSEIVLAVNDAGLRAQLVAFALGVFDALGARDYGRIDIRLDASGRPNFLEANLIPSLIDNYGSFPKACWLNAGLAYEPMILRIARLGLARNTPVLEPEPVLTPLILDIQAA